MEGSGGGAGSRMRSAPTVIDTPVGAPCRRESFINYSRTASAPTVGDDFLYALSRGRGDAINKGAECIYRKMYLATVTSLEHNHILILPGPGLSLMLITPLLHQLIPEVTVE